MSAAKMAINPLAVLAAMEGDLGKQRVDALPLHDCGRSSYEPPRTRVIRNAVTNRISSAWKNAISSGIFNDSDAEAVRGLDNLGGTRLYDKVNPQRTSVRPPPPPSVARPSASSSALRSVDRSSASGINGGAKNGTGVPPRPPPVSSTTARAPTTSHNVKVNSGHGTPPLPVAPRGQRVSVPPTPGPSPTAPSSGTKVGAPRARPAAPVPTSPPKPGRGLGASRWAVDEGQSKPATESQAQGTDQVLTSEAKTLQSTHATESRAQKPDQVSTSEAKMPDAINDLASSQSTGGQATPRDTPSEIQIYEETQALSKLKITDSTTAKAELIDPLTGEKLEPGFVAFARAQLLVGEPVEKRSCAIYLGARDQDCPAFEVAFQKEMRVSHNLLDMLRHSHGGVFLDVAFRSGPNDILNYSFELETGHQVAVFLRALELLRELTVDALFEDLTDIEQASASMILARQNASRRNTSSPVEVVTVKYSFSPPAVKKRHSEPATTAREPLIPPPRQSYTPEQLLSLRREEENQPNPLADVDFIRAVKRGGRKRTDSKECVVGRAEPSSRGTVAPADEKSPSDVLGEVRRTVAAARDWVSRNGEVGL